jgi:hypothetical protein
MDPVLELDKKPDDARPKPSSAEDTANVPGTFPAPQGAGNQAMQTLLRPSTPAPVSPQKLNQEEEQGAPTSPVQEQRWASEFAGDEARLVGILTSVFYTEDDEAQAISILSRWARRQTPADRKASTAAAQGLEGIHSIHFGLRSSYLDDLLEKLRQTQVWTRTGRTTAYEAMFRRFDPQNVRQVRSIRDTSSIKFVGQEEQADERKEEDLSAEGIFGWRSNKFEAAAPSEDIADKKRAEWVLDYLKHTPPNKMTPELRVLSDAISRGGGKAFLLQRSHVVTAGDRVRFAREIAGRAVVTVLEYAMWEIGAGAVEAVVPEVLEGAAGAETAGAAGRTEAESRAALSEGGAARSEIGSAVKDVDPYLGEPGTHLSVKDTKSSTPTPPTETPANALAEAPHENVDAITSDTTVESGVKEEQPEGLSTEEAPSRAAVEEKPPSKEPPTTKSSKPAKAPQRLAGPRFERGGVGYRFEGTAENFAKIKSSPPGSQVYIVRNAAGKPIYVGITERTSITRLLEHLGKQPGEWLGSASQIEIVGEGLLEREARGLEQDLIEELKPEFNNELDPFTRKFKTAPDPADVQASHNTRIILDIIQGI